MFGRREQENIWAKSHNVDAIFPVSYSSLIGYERFAVLRVLSEPVQSTLHQIIQQKVAPNTPCLRKTCCGKLDETGTCSEKCAQSGKTVVHDIIECKNCDYFGFPCSNCNQDIFHNQLKEYMDY